MTSTTKNKSEKLNTSQTQRICMLVRNSVIRDARVMKEATSLTQEGYTVLVIGLQEEGATELCIEVKPGLKIVRVPWRKQIALYDFFFTLLFVLAVFIFLLFTGYLTGEYLTTFIKTNLSIPAVLFALIPSCFFLVLAKRKLMSRYRRYRELARKESAAEHLDTKSLWSRLYIRANRHRLFCKKSFSIFLTDRYIRNIIYEFGPDILHCHDIGTLNLGVSTKKKLGCKLVYDAHEIYEEAIGVDDFMKVIYNRIHVKAQEHLDGFITINESIIDYYSTHYPKFPKATLVMNATRQVNGVTYDGRLHKRADLPLERNILLFQGGFTPMRGIPLLLKTVPFLPDNWSLVFMGWGKLEPEILRAAQKINKDTAFPKLVVIPPAPQDELVHWTAGATIGIIPYEDHGLNHKFCTPNKLWEYPNARVPILVTPRVEMKKMVTQYNYGWVLDEPVTPEYLAEVINSLTRKDIEQAKVACEKFIQNCNWRIFECNLLDLYTNLSS